jgi:hypothetical protein
MNYQDVVNRELVVSGSFRKHFEHVVGAVEKFKNAGFLVIAPSSLETVDGKADFVFLSGDDQDRPAHDLEMDYMRAIGRSSFLYVINVDGRVGHSAAAEMAYAGIKGIPVLTAEIVSDVASELPEGSLDFIRSLAVGVVRLDNINQEIVSEVLGNRCPILNHDESLMASSIIKGLISSLVILDI